VPPMTPMLARSATAGQATFEPDDDDEPDDEPVVWLLFFSPEPLELLELLELLESLPDELEDPPSPDDLPEPLLALSFEDSADTEPLRLSVR
jgi:hypothetical protein